MKKLNSRFLFIFIFLGWTHQIIAQENRGRSGYMVSASCYLLFQGGGNFSLSAAMWQKFKYGQPSANLSWNLLFGKNHLGNRNQYKTRFQSNVIFSPMMSFCTGDSVLQERVNVSYLGHLSSVYNYSSSAITVGTSFIASPKGYGDNVASSRNRSQQLIFVQLKGGWKAGKQRENAIINLYEDFLFTDGPFGQIFADNFDRFYTGGGSFHLRLTNELAITLYDEVYTGNSYKDQFDFPDLVKKDSAFQSGNKKRNSRYAYQDPGQYLFNEGRMLVNIEYTNYSLVNRCYTKANLFIGGQGGNYMWVQNVIHNTQAIDKKNPYNPAIRDSYRHFRPYKKKRFIIGGGFELINAN